VLYVRVLSFVILQVSMDTLSMEAVATRVNVKLLVKDRAKADVTRLPRVDRDVLVSHAALLSAELFSAA
jgi:hypothetical protein